MITIQLADNFALLPTVATLYTCFRNCRVGTLGAF